MKKIFAILLSITILNTSSFSAFAAESEASTISENPISNSVYMSATDKENFAAQMDTLYAQKVIQNEVKMPTREIVDSLLLQVSIATPQEQERINAELESYGVYKYDSSIIERPATRTGTGDVSLATPTIYYEAWSNYWSVTCGGEWKNTDYGDFFGDVGGADGFGVGYTNCSNGYKSHVVSASAFLTDDNNKYYESTSNRSDGDGSKGFGFRLQDSWQGAIGNYVGHKWSGICTYDSWFGNYNGIATAYYVHTYDTANLKGVSFGIDGKTAGISAEIEFAQDSFTAFSNDKTFGVYP